ALYGAKNCKVVNNTVVRNPFNYFFPSFKAWIRINPRKESAGGDLSTGNLVRNNIMATYQDEGQEPASVDNNTLGTNYSSSFQDYQGWNFYLSANSPAIDAGIAEDAPFIDADKKRRTVGAVDRGCFEYNASTEDRDAPTLPSNISASQITEGSISLDWDASSDNEGVAYYEINIDGKIIRSATPSAYIPNLQPNTEYTVGVKAVDFFDNKSPATLHTETTQALGMMAVFFVSADRHDHVIKSNSKLMWVGMPYLRVGGYYGSSDASAVLPFKLPCLESNYQIVSANLATYLDERVGATEGSLDVYGLGIRPTACVATTDHWEGMYSGDDANGTLITQNYITPQTNTGLVELASSDESALGTYLQGLYDIGGCDGFAYLRLNENTTQEQNNTYYKIVSADNSNSFQVPLLKVIASESTAVKPLEIKNGVAIFPNPTNGKEVTMQIKGFEAEPTIIVIHNAKGQEVFRKTFNNLENESTLNLKTDLVSGMYFVTVLGRQKYAQTKLIVALR
ncbi:MAG TPA: T9SS type A sorting domain-containing protein, partial [Phaeodactylibacter sp.]|nr:T9SS type A sorting domain-containing protein [Phaeodactylibacter sp.]